MQKPWPPEDETERLLEAGRAEIHRGRPLAAWSNFKQAQKLSPDDDRVARELRMLRSLPVLPAAARREYALRKRGASGRADLWAAALDPTENLDPTTVEQRFRAIVESDPTDSAAWFNLALCQAWCGSNAQAIDSLDHACRIDATAAFDLAVEAWLLAEILRQGAGAEELCDDLEHSLVAELLDGDDPLAWLSPLGKLFVLEPIVKSDGPAQERYSIARYELWSQPGPTERSAVKAARLYAKVFIETRGGARSLAISSFDPRRIGDLEELISQILGPSSDRWRRWSRPLSMFFWAAAAWPARLPWNWKGEETDAQELLRELVEEWFEHVWIAIPRHGLGGVSPAAAARC